MIDIARLKADALALPVTSPAMIGLTRWELLELIAEYECAAAVVAAARNALRALDSAGAALQAPKGCALLDHADTLRAALVAHDKRGG